MFGGDGDDGVDGDVVDDGDGDENGDVGDDGGDSKEEENGDEVHDKLMLVKLSIVIMFNV